MTTKEIWRRSGCAKAYARMVSARGPYERVGCTSFCKTGRSQPATVAVAARSAIGRRIVTAVREAVIKTERQAEANDVGLRQLNERRVDRQRPPLDSSLGSQAGQLFEGADEFGPAVRVARVIKR